MCGRFTLRTNPRDWAEVFAVIRDIEDEKREDIQWAIRNGQPILHLTSMSRDPADPHWADHLNKLVPTDESSEPDRPTQARYQGTLW